MQMRIDASPLTSCLLLVLLVLPAVAETDGKLLGDESDGSRAHSFHLMPLYPENEDGEKGGKITPDDETLLPFSTRWTCGECHSYGIIRKGWHFNAIDPNVVPGRAGEPWILFDARLGIQIPLSYRRWPGTFRPEQVGLTARQFTLQFGRHMPGGGPGEIETDVFEEISRQFVSGKLEINCLSCHNAHIGQNQGGMGGYAVQVVRENFRWAAAASCEFASVSGSARDMGDTYDPFMPEPPEDPKKVPPTVTYRKHAFDSENQVLFHIVRQVPSERCYYCHSDLYLGQEDAEKWSCDEDVHLTAGLTCVDCHRNGVEHDMIRGYEEESSISRNPLAATSSCRSCHEQGRLGAPVPEHPGIPPIHFEKLTCTACHSGPWPTERTHLTKTSRAHRLGTLNVNKSSEVLPHIVSAVLAKQRGMIVGYLGGAFMLGNGKIAPHKLIWPAYWGTLRGQNVTLVDLDVVKQTIGGVLAGLELPQTGDWPDLTEEHIAKGLKSLQKAGHDKPVYVTAGKVYRLDDSGNLHSEQGHPAAEPYLWPIAHPVRPAAQSLGVRRCEDCHSTDAPFFFGQVAVDSPIVSERDSAKRMVEFQDINAFYAWAFAFSFVFRPWLKVVTLGSCAILAGVLLLYALRALACIAKALVGGE
jgi:hypothetical protein